MGTISSESQSEVKILSQKADNLCHTIPLFCDSVTRFADEAQAITKRWRECSVMLSKHSQLLELLEIPNLMDNCVRLQCYDEALKLYLYVQHMYSNNQSIELLRCLAHETSVTKQLMMQQLLQDLQGNSQLPNCLKIVSLLRKLDVFTESEIRITFLTSRDSWMESLIKAIPVTPAILHLTRFIDVLRVNIFDTVTQYQAIFPGASSPSLLSLTTSSSLTQDNLTRFPVASTDETTRDADYSDSNILTSWFIYKIDSSLDVIRQDLVSCIESEPFYPIDSLIDPCFYFGLSLTRIGADIRPRLLVIFNNVFLRRFKRVLGRAVNTFLQSLSNYEAMQLPAAGFSFSNEKDPTSGEEVEEEKRKASTPPHPPKMLLQFEPLALFLNGIISALNEIRPHASIMNVCKMRDALNESLVRGTEGILNLCLKIRQKDASRAVVLDQICTLYTSFFLTHVSEIFACVFPGESLAKSLGVSLLDFMKLRSKADDLNLIQINGKSELLQDFRQQEEDRLVTMAEDDVTRSKDLLTNDDERDEEKLSFQEGSPARTASLSSASLSHVPPLVSDHDRHSTPVPDQQTHDGDEDDDIDLHKQPEPASEHSDVSFL